jgi:lipopolysaccharide assembly outer membrane protein LptD (OstA)
VILFFFHSGWVQGQDTVRPVPVHLDTVLFLHDTLHLADTALHHPSDSLKVKKTKKKDNLKSKVEYTARDSLRFDIKEQKVYLFRDADIKYEDIGLKSGYVEIDFPKKTVYATGIKDSTGKEIQVPEFTQAAQKFKSKVMTYNYDTKRGYIQNVFTKQDEGYLHGTIVKKMENDITYLKDGWYTTCDRENDPHYEFKFGRAKVIPGKKVITGPAYLVIANVPVPLGIPFGYFPSKAGRRSGIVMPTYGESNNRGFFLENGGYYWAMNKYVDLFLVGDIYSHGSWAVKPRLKYNYRYHYNGNLNFSYASNKIGDVGSPDYQKSSDFNVQWTHIQDPKARPHSRFSANVNIVSQNFNKYNPVTNVQTYLSNTFSSSINYAADWNNNYNLNINFSHSQNTLTKTINITLPDISFSINQFYPFRTKTRAGKMRWYENINMKYNLDAKNIYNTTDTLIFKKKKWWNDMQNGIQHSLPITATFHILKYFNLTTSILLNDRMYFSTIRKRYVLVKNNYSTGIGVAGKDSLVVDTIRQFANAFDGNVSASLNTTLYGMYQFKKGPIIAIRHMITPNVSYTYTPNFGSSGWGYYRYAVNDPNKNPQKYSIFEGSLYSGPPARKSGVVNFSLRNNLEMKVRDRKDTVTGTKKIILIENLTFNESYDMTKDSMRWSTFTIQGYTTLFKNLRVTYSSSWDPYARDSLGNSINKTEWDLHRRLLRLDQTVWDLGLTYTLSSDKSNKKKTTKKGTEQERKDLNDYYDYYVDFDIPWSFNLSYKFNVNKTWNTSKTYRVGLVTQTLGFNGQLNITPKWKITLSTGWDFTNGQLSFTSIDLYRDLHCWEMRFGWIPKGAQQSWNFSINVKASVLQDLKLNKKKDFRDYTQ